MRTFSFCVRLAFVVFFVISFSFYIYSIKVEDILIILFFIGLIGLLSSGVTLWTS